MEKTRVATSALFTAIALVVVGVFNSALAEEGGLPVVEDALITDTTEAADEPRGAMPPNCCLRGRHFNFLRGKIASLEVEAAGLRDQIRGQQRAVRAGESDSQLQSLNSRLELVNSRLAAAYSSPPWAGWHLRVGLLTQTAWMSGSQNHAVPLQLDISGEYIDGRTHLGWRGGGSFGVWFTEGNGGKELAPVAVTGHMSAVAGWEHWSILLPQVRANYLQPPINGTPGLLWVGMYGGGEVHVERTFYVNVLLGTAVYSTLQRLGGLHGLLGMGWYY